jgi:ring-1,2-phenylacetyl-CoA epoxidase subunit PaaC
LAYADDKLVLAHRNSEWCGHAPILEEDIAFANLALDELGHAVLWYQILAELLSEDPELYPDQLVYGRSASQFRCSHFVALPNGDFGFSMLRQYLFDQMDSLRLQALMTSDHQPMAQAAAKIFQEERYHLRHTRSWVRRLALGTAESKSRMQHALDALWPYAGQLFAPIEPDDLLLNADTWPDSADLETAWRDQVGQFISGCELQLPQTPFKQLDRRLPAQHLVDVLAELQQVARLDPGASW